MGLSKTPLASIDENERREIYKVVIEALNLKLKQCCLLFLLGGYTQVIP